MPAPVKVIFVTAGAKEVEAVFGSLTKKMQAFARTQMTTATRAAQASTAATTSSSKQMDAIRARTATMAGQHAVRAAKAEAAAAKQSAKAVATEAKRVDKIRERSALMAGRYAAKAAAAEEAAAKRAAKARIAAERAANAEQAKLGRRGAVAGSAAMGGLRRAYGSATGAAGMLTAGVGVAAIGSGVNDAYMLNRRGALLSNITQMPGVTARSGAELVSMARAPAVATGTSAEDVMSMMEIVGARAGGAVGIEKLRGDLLELTKAAVATGTSMEDMGGVVAAAFNAGVKPGEDMLALVRTMNAQTKAGQIEMADFASELSRLGGVGTKWGTGAEMLADVGGLAQLAAITSGGSPEQSRTTVVDMMREFSQGPKIRALQGMGVETSGTDGYMRHPFEVLADTINAVETGEDPKSMAPQLKGLTGEARQRAIYSTIFTGRSGELAGTMRKTYMQGYTGQYGERAGKKYTGREAVMAQLEESARPYKQTKEQAEAEYQNVAKTMEIARAHEQFKEKMAAVLPQLEKLIPMLIKAADGFAKLVVWLGKNPLQGMGVMLGAAMSREIAAAAMSKTIEAGFANIAASIVGGKGSGGVLGALGALGTITLAATTVYLIAETGLKELFDTGEAAGKRGVEAEMSSIATQREARGVIASGQVTPEHRARLVKKLDDEAAAARTASDTMTGGRFIGGKNVDAGMLIAGSTGGGISALFAALAETLVSKTAAQQGTNVESLKEVEARANELAVSLSNLKTATDSVGGSLANPGAGARTTPASRAGVK